MARAYLKGSTSMARSITVARKVRLLGGHKSLAVAKKVLLLLALAYLEGSTSMAQSLTVAKKVLLRGGRSRSL